jgi:quercetin dioxygenase-like cupin family protein
VENKQQENLAASPFNLAEMVAWQEGAVVSRTLIDKKAGTVTLFSFDAGQGLSKHTAPFDAMVMILDGTAEISISGNRHTVRAGEMIIMPANKPHALKAAQRFKMALIMIKADS